MRLCDRIVVLNKGQRIAMGTPKRSAPDPAVIEAYIGRKRAAQALAQKPGEQSPIGQTLPTT